MLPTKFHVNWLSFQKNRKIDFQDGGHGSHHEFRIVTILAIFDLQVTPMLPTKFQVNWPFSSGEAKNRFSKWRQFNGFSIRTILTVFFLQVAPMLHTKFQVSWLFSSGEEAKNRLSRWQPLQPSCISNQNNFSYF